ncbi:hypothetical protein AG0111_0g1901 [Alternaria gaisen]|uniref:Uncharacterized protein n=1 Tax=Alternaria gaisen TaxID=167740 RepID=A0ACB6G0S7_9PLEO|nr:hypothetical protein AG0111_0g1901 [Alternaria gaisen]
MSTDPPSTLDRLSPSWIRRPMSRRSTSPQKESRPTTANGLLSPEPVQASSNSDGSRSPRSSSSGRRGSVMELVNRLRSTSNASLSSNKSQDADFSEIENWFFGFRKYNQLVSNTITPNQAYPSKEFSRASKALTKNCGGNFLHGLPEAVFDFSLLWCPAGQMTKKDVNEPSWSWTAYEGPVNFPFDPTTCPDIYKIPRSEGEWFQSEVVNFHIGPESAQYTVRREKGNSLRIRYPPYFHAPRGSDHSNESNTLRFTAQTISADAFIAEQIQHEEKDIPCSHLINVEKNLHCGVIMDYESAISEPSSTGPFEFVLLSRSLWREPSPDNRKPGLNTMHPPGTPIWNGERFLWDSRVHDHDEQFASGPWKMLNVMLIKWVGEHAERVAIARIHEDEWLQHNPTRTDIVLR